MKQGSSFVTFNFIYKGDDNEKMNNKKNVQIISNPNNLEMIIIEL